MVYTIKPRSDVFFVCLFQVEFSVSNVGYSFASVN